jgi:hypothetical protein
VEFFTSSWVVESWNLSSMSLLLSLFLKSIGENTILWFLNVRHSGTLLCGTSPQLNKCSFSSYTLKAKYVELVGKEKGYNSSHVYCQAKGWSRKSSENFLNDFEKGFLNGMMEGEKMKSHKKGSLKLKCFVPLKILTSPFI